VFREDIVEFFGARPRPAQGLGAAGETPIREKFKDGRCEGGAAPFSVVCH